MQDLDIVTQIAKIVYGGDHAPLKSLGKAHNNPRAFYKNHADELGLVIELDELEEAGKLTAWEVFLDHAEVNQYAIEVDLEEEPDAIVLELKDLVNGGQLGSSFDEVCEDAPDDISTEAFLNDIFDVCAEKDLALLDFDRGTDAYTLMILKADDAERIYELADEMEDEDASVTPLSGEDTVTTSETVLELEDGPLESIAFRVDDECPEELVEGFTEWLVDYVESRPGFESEEIIQYGWTTLRCMVDGSTMALEAPDLESIPMGWQVDLGPAIETAIEHLFVPESFDFEPELSTLNDTAKVGPAFDDFPVVMIRQQGESNDPDDAGWVVVGGPAEKIDTSQLDQMSLYEIAVEAPHLVRYLTMPTGVRIEIEDEDTMPRFLLDGKEVSPEHGSYLEDVLDEEIEDDD